MPDTDLNTDNLVLWFDDLGSGNEDYNYLSNFYEGEPFSLPGVTKHALVAASTDVNKGEAGDSPIMFATGEHAFQAMKFWGSDWTYFLEIANSVSPSESKYLGRSRKHPLRADWEVVKLDVMCAVVRTKFSLTRDEGQRLLTTGDKMLVEGTWWHDDVWGVDLSTSGLPGRNWLGTILMARRAELRAMKALEGMTPEDFARVLHFGNRTGVHNSAFAAGA